MSWKNYSTNSSTVLSEMERPIIGTLLGIIAICAFLGNVVVILAFALSRKLHTTTNFFVVNLSVADLVTGVSIPVNVVAITSPRQVPEWLCAACGFCSIVVIGCSVYTLACIAVYRFVFVTSRRRARFKTCLRKPAVISVTLGLTWAIPILMASVPSVFGLCWFGYNAKFSSCTWTESTKYSLFYSLLLVTAYYPIPTVIVVTSYIKIFLHLRSVRRQVGPDRAAPRQPLRGSLQAWRAPARDVNKRQVTVTKNMFYVVCAFLICMTPYPVVLVFPGSDFFIPYAAVILMLNSTINPVIYAIKHPDFSKAMRSVASCNFNKIPHFVLR